VPPDEAGRRLVASVDGSFEIVLGDPPAGAPRVMLETRDGALGTPDFSLEIRPLAALAATARSA